MFVYQVLQKPRTIDAPPKDDDSVLIAERFSWFAALLPPVWMLSHKLWLEAVFWLAAMFGLVALGSFIGSEAVFWIYIIGAVWLGFEASAIRARSLKRRGFNFAGDLLARDYGEALNIWFRHRVGP